MYIPKNHNFNALVEKHGSPLYVYDSNHIRKQYQLLKSCFPLKNLEIHYAVKANSHPEIIQLLHAEGAGIDAVSIEETQIALDEGVNHKDIFFTPSGASFDEIETAVSRKIQVTIDSISQLLKWAEKFPDTPLCLRFNPKIKAGGSEKISVGHKASKFGIAIDNLPEVESIVSEFRLNVAGVHMHIGSDVYQIDAMREAIKSLHIIAESFSETLEFINYGGGFKVTYHPDERRFDIRPIAEFLSEKHIRFCKKIGRQLTPIIEPGKYLVSEAGVFVAKVNVVKESYGTQFAILNTGFNHFMRPMYYDAYHHILNISNPGGELNTYNICGYICEEDTFARDRLLPEIHEGDYLVFLNAGAYSYSMASNYNSKEKPVEVVV